MNYLQAIFIIFFYIGLSIAIDIDPSKTVVWGPGLNPGKIVMRARYFFLQLKDSHEQNLTKSPGEEIVFATIKGRNSNNYACRVWTQIFDCKDGSFIIRYKLFETCYDFNINIRVKDHVLPSASISEEGPIYEEECDCPNPHLESWLNDYQCSLTYPQIVEDLKPFSEVDFDQIRNDLIKTYHKPHSHSFCHYVIKNNEIYRKCYGQHVGFKVFSDSILLSLARKVHLPDSEFFMNLGDWPLVLKNNYLYPMFSWCGSNDTNDIVLPTYDITESSLENMGRVMLDVLSVQGNIKTLWEKKIEKVFWRGRDARRERLDLIDIARKNPDLFNVSITNFFFFKNEIDKYGPGERHISFFDFFKYKYQLNIDGTVAAYRQPYLLAGDSLVFKQTSKYYEFFYHHLVPYKHFIPINHDLSDLVEKVKWAKENDEEALKIARNGRELIRQVALPGDVFCYYVSLLKEWNERTSNKVRVLDSMERVSQPEHTCKCHHDSMTKLHSMSKIEL